MTNTCSEGFIDFDFYFQVFYYPHIIGIHTAGKARSLINRWRCAVLCLEALIIIQSFNFYTLFNTNSC